MLRFIGNYQKYPEWAHMSKNKRVLILGYGEMGRALAHLINGRADLDIWVRTPVPGIPVVELEQAAAGADMVLFCLPVNPHRLIAEKLAPLLKSDCICISIAKGLDEQGQAAYQIFQDVYGNKQAYAVLYGPMISEEIRAGRQSFCQISATDPARFEQIKGIFQGSNFHMAWSDDMTGISWSVILKNVYAMLFGVADELVLGDNMRGFLATAALKELSEIVQDMGGQADSAYHLPGLGDLITTATSEDSHHHELGRLIARGQRQGLAGEGIHTLAMVKKFQPFKSGNYPLFQLVDNIVNTELESQAAINRYIESYF
jgi:glycerol-3-phosphate dehydrogenase (NAD(P)+)